MEWKYVKVLENENLVNEFENEYQISFPKGYRSCVIANNGGRPSKKGFSTLDDKEHWIKTFLSFNKDDLETVWGINEWLREELADQYIAFADDDFGNLICFNSDLNILFYDLENDEMEYISDSFDTFMNSLHE